MTKRSHGALELRIDGSVVETDADMSLVRLVVGQCLSAPAVCEATLLLTTDSAGVNAAPGSSVSVRVPGESTSLFDGAVSGVTRRFRADGICEIRVRAYDALHELRRSQPIRVHANVTAAQLARALVGPLGIDVVASEEGPHWPNLFQYAHTDLDLLVAAAGASGLWLTLRERDLHLMTPEGIGDLSTLALGADLIEASIEMNVDSACASVEAHGYDLLTDSPRRGTARTTRVPAPQPKGGADLALCGLALESDDLLSAAAQAELDRRASRSGRCEAIAIGSPSLRPGCRIQIDGVGQAVDGSFVVTTATHRFTPDDGYTTEVGTVLPTTAPLDTAPLVAPCKVESVEDPDALGRVRVALAGRGDLASAWLPVLTPAAGAGKGLIALPDVGDDVLVLFAGGVVGQAVVLGGLFGTRGLPDGRPRNGAIDRYAFLTPKGQSVTLDDTARSVRLATQDGSYVELSPEHLTMHAACDLTIESPGRFMRFRADRVDFQRG